MNHTQPLTKQLNQLKKLLTSGQIEEAISKAETLQSQHSSNLEIMWVLAKLYQESNHLTQLQIQLELIHNLHPNEVQALVQLANLSYRLKNHKEALDYINQAEQLAPKDVQVLNHKSIILIETFQYDDAIDTLKKIVELGKAPSYVWSNLGLAHQSLGLFELAEGYYLKAIEMAGTKDASPYNNLIMLNHYVPKSSPQKIFNLATRWEKKYARKLKPLNLDDRTKLPNKKLRIGMLSDGFNTHPVGQMITQILELLPKHEIELFAYSTSLKEDPITKRIKHCVAQWRAVDHLNEQQLAEQLAKDQLDIIFDLSGHTNGCRLRTMAMKPAPILVKWVGGLINTTGLSTMDYLLSDSIETPEGVDEWYTEKLIRMPHDYVCYEAPAYSHDVYSPPATHNGYITLGCFNTPQKINNIVLEKWAEIMHQLPNSKLFLKSFQFNSSILVENVTKEMESLGITKERLIIEGPSSHSELLKAYNKVDIALDPWPYSGGLTTCEAMFMGVPVVTYPGPTFAGRHSATHLTNVGLGQLVANSWEEYQALVLNLANDLDNLSNIREHLRGALLESPLCDAQSFARHFANAMRAIWQRHCEGLPPAALTLNAEGECQFADQSAAIQLQLPDEPKQDSADSNDEQPFSFNFTGLITALDHGATLASRPYFRDFLKKGGVNYICLDPGGVVRNAQQLQHTGLFHHFPLMVLGDGSKMELRLAVEAELSSTLLPPSEPEHPEVIPSVTPPTLVSTTTANSNRIDDIEGIDSIDWLILDTQHHNLSILQHGQQKLADALLIEVGVCFLPNHSGQVDFGAINQQLEGLGFRLLNLNNIEHHNLLPQLKNDHIKNEVFSGQAVYIPNNKSLIKLNKNQLQKLAFLLDSIYSFKDVAYHLINYIDSNQALNYLKNKNLSVNFENKNLEIRSKLNDKKPNFIHLCFNNMHTERAVELAESDFINEHSNNIVFIEKHRSVTGYDIAEKISDKNSVIFNKNTDLDIILEQCTLPEVKAIFIHGLFFEWQFNLIERIGKNKKVIWGIWGGDLYNRNNSARNTNIINNYVDFIATFDKSELSFFKLKYNKKKQFDLQYSFDIENSDDTEIKKKKTIVLGNSGDPSNNHIEILITLSKITDINDYKIVMPFSYNYSNEYLVEVTNKLENLNLKNVNVMTKFIKKKDYNKLLGEACLLITAHNRQQALGNITTAISMETPVIIRKNITLDNKKYKNPTWANLVEKHSIYLYDFEELINTKSIKKVIEKVAPYNENNKKIIKNIFGKEYSYKLFNNLTKQL